MRLRRQAMIIVVYLAAVTACAGTEEPSADSPPATSAPDSGTGTSGWWAPEVGASWQYQLQGDIDTTVEAAVFDVDLFNTDAGLVREIKADGRRAICYVSVGTYEQWRPDASRFPAEVVGLPLPEWPGESWLDVRRLDVLEPIMAARMDLCRAKGFDAVEPDNLDAYQQDSGFDITPAHQLAYNRMIARLAHDRSLGVGLKNAVAQVEELVGDFDFAVNESCVEEGECERLRPFIDAGKAVLHVEYDLPTSVFCPITAPLGLSSIRKPLSLTAAIEACPAPEPS
jgi:hypothetical protein